MIVRHMSLGEMQGRGRFKGAQAGKLVGDLGVAIDYAWARVVEEGGKEGLGCLHLQGWGRRGPSRPAVTRTWTVTVSLPKENKKGE